MDKRRAQRVICAWASGERGEGQWGGTATEACGHGGENIARGHGGIMAVGRDVPIAPHRPVVVRNARG